MYTSLFMIAFGMAIPVFVRLLAWGYVPEEERSTTLLISLFVGATTSMAATIILLQMVDKRTIELSEIPIPWVTVQW